MAILGIGIDVVEVDRVRSALEAKSTGRRFRERVFTATERGECDARPTPVQSYAARFAAKEAVMKALGIDGRWGFPWPDIEIRRDRDGAPSVVLARRADERARRLGVARVHVSLSHTDAVAVANAVAETAR